MIRFSENSDLFQILIKRALGLYFRQPTASFTHIVSGTIFLFTISVVRSFSLLRYSVLQKPMTIVNGR